MVNVIIGERIKKIREEKKITREALAGKAGISTKFLYEIENGKKGISAETVLKIANALSCSCDLILKGEDLVQRPLNNCHIYLYIFPIAQFKNPQRSSLRLRFLNCTLRKIYCVHMVLI